MTVLSSFRHTGLVVRDVNKAQAFYAALGFTEVARDIESGYFIEQVTGFEDAKLEWVKLTLDGGILLELLQYHTPGNHELTPEPHPKFAGNYPPDSYPTNMHGCSHVAYTTPDIDACCDKILAAGGSLVNPPAPSPNGKVKVAYAYDLDGILMEIVEELGESESG